MTTHTPQPPFVNLRTSDVLVRVFGCYLLDEPIGLGQWPKSIGFTGVSVAERVHHLVMDVVMFAVLFTGC